MNSFNYDRPLGQISLHKAAAGNHVDCVRLIVHLCKESVDVTDTAGWTPLMRAAAKGHREVSRALLDAQANTRLTNKDGMTASQIARKNRFGDG